MDIIEKLLIREDIDALEFDLARARERDPKAIPSIQAEIERLESLLRSPRRHCSAIQR